MISDAQGVQFLQWSLPRLHLRWRGFRKVRRQVYKRISRRLEELALPGVEAYRMYLEDHPEEWPTIDALCRIGISRFYRDRSVFEHLEHEVLPELVQTLAARGEDEIRCWSAGCAGGEEPYTIAIIWRDCLAMRFPGLRLKVLATDSDPQAICRAERGCYRVSSVKDLPAERRAGAFVTIAGELCIKDAYRSDVTFSVQDIREQTPEGPFHLILCRNLVFTYFDEALQRKILQTLAEKLAPGGALVIGKLEWLPDGQWGIQPWPTRLGVYRKPADARP
jgi:chemotaxis protein methyltransferase CheR